MPLSNIIFLIAIALSGCTGASALSPTSGGESIPPTERTVNARPAKPTKVMELSYDKTVDYRDIELRWLTLKDSRCPIGVNCMWAGQIQATVEVVHSERGKIELELLRRAAREPEVEIAFGHELRLREVLPNPKVNVVPDRSEYRMFVEIGQP